MKFWVYAIDWRSMAIEIIEEHNNESGAQKFADGYVAGLPVAERDDFVAFKTIGITPVTPDIEAAVQQFKRLNGRVA
jgi:hypothetical protein